MTTDTQWASIRDFSNLRFIESKMPPILLHDLNLEIDKLSKNSEPYNHRLQGHMKEEYSLDHVKGHFENWLLSVSKSWIDANPGYLDEFEEVSKCESYNLYLDRLWVNKQRKYEFNPIHHHLGALSFVIFVKIPYNLKDELNYFPLISGTSDEHKDNFYTSKFCFVYNDVLGKIKQLAVPVDKTFEGTILMFPSSLLHTVYPFYTSDDYRISVSGNIRIQSEKN
tara:strand:+ start:267 stop:938 length:672 start_codon:yes stop_codon:yes gene_type:complete